MDRNEPPKGPDWTAMDRNEPPKGPDWTVMDRWTYKWPVVPIL